MKSKFFSLDSKDLIRGFLVAVVTAILTGALQLFQGGEVQWTFSFWQPTIYGGIASGIAYLLKNLLTNSGDELLKSDK